MPLWSLSTILNLGIVSLSPDNTDVAFHQPSVPLPCGGQPWETRKKGRVLSLLWVEKRKAPFLPPPTHALKSEAFPECQGLIAC